MPLDPASLLKPVEQRIERGDVETQRPARTGLDQFGNLVAVPLPDLNEREDQQLGAALLQFAVENSSVYICHSHILCRLIYGVNRRRVPGKISTRARVCAAGGSVIGKTVRIDGAPYTIIGVTAPGVRLVLNIDLWLPYITPQTPSRGDRELEVFGRLADGVSISQANAEAGAVARQLAAEFPSTNKDIGAMVQDFNEAFIRVQIRRVLQALLGGVAFVLLIACANVANLLLGRAVIRSREMAIRAALGAGRLRVIRQLLTESVLLSVMAGVLGAFLAYWGVRAFAAGDFNKPDYIVFSVDRNVLLYLAAISLGTGILFGLAPALRMSRIDLSGAL